MTIAKTSIESLTSLRLPELQSLYAEVIGKPTKSPNKTFLIKKIREALAAQAAEVVAEVEAIAEMTAATTEPAEEAASAPETTTEPTPAEESTSVPTPATEPASEEPTPEIAEEPASAPESADCAEPANEDEEIEMLADAAELAEMEATEESTSAADAGNERKLSKLSVAELQARYLEVVGRPTGSSHKRYLIWKIREAQKGRIPTGPRTTRTSTNDTEMKILPLRMEEDLVARLDEARQRLGLRSRMDLIRAALCNYLAGAGETELAAEFASK